MTTDVLGGVVAFAGLAIVMPGGRVSVKSKKFMSETFKRLSIVKVRVERDPSETLDGENDFENPGNAPETIRSAVAAPLLPAEDVKSPDILLCVPSVLEVTSTETVQLELPPTPEPGSPVNVMVAPPSGALSVPPQVADALAGVAMNMPAGKLSLNARLVSGLALGLVMVKTSIVVLPGPMLSGVKTLLKVGSAGCASAAVEAAARIDKAIRKNAIRRIVASLNRQ